MQDTQKKRKDGRTNYHARTDITKLWFLAVMVLELVRSVTDWLDWFCRKWFIFLFLFHLLIIDEIHLESRGRRFKAESRLSTKRSFKMKQNGLRLCVTVENVNGQK